MSVIPAQHRHITERDGTTPWNDCTWASGLEWYRLVYDASRPATIAEMHALRAASGEPTTGGSNLGDLARGIAARYHVTIPARVDNNTLPQPGQAAVVQGSMVAFGSSNPLSKWDPSFDDSHAVLVMNLGGVFYWCDPEAPAGAAVPVVISKADLLAFISKFNGQSVIGNIKGYQAPAQEADMLPLTTSLLGAKFTIKSGSNIRVEPRIASTKVRATTAVEVVSGGVGTFKGDVDPANGSDVWYGWVENGAWRFTAKDNVTLVTPSTTTDDGYTKATQDAAVAAALAPVNAALAASKAQVTSLTTDNAALKSQRDALQTRLNATFSRIDALKG